jgi:DNA topoisomerase-3
LTELQRDANRRFGWPASKTLETAQALYEKRKLITYPRTDSRYLSRDLFKTLKGRVAKLDVEPWQEFAKQAMQSDRNLFGRVINDAHVSDHHAIIPTGRDIPKEMPEEEAKLFDLIARRFIAIFFPDQEVEFQTVTTRAEKQPFLSKGRKEMVAGWSAIYAPLDAGKKRTKSSKGDEFADLPDLNEGDDGKVKSARAEEKETQPPSRYTEASLLSAMENAGRFIEDEELREQMKDSGLGTPATRAAIIERLIQVRYVRRAGRILAPTAKGCAFVDVLVDELSSPELTGLWEKELAEIGRGEMDPQAFMGDIRKLVVKIVDASKKKVEGANFPEEKRAKPSGPKEPVGICPLCGSSLFENSKTFYCARWRYGCKFSIWKDAASKSGGPEIDVDLAKKLLEGKPLVGHTGTLTMLKRAPYVEWQPRPGASSNTAAEGEAAKRGEASETSSDET